MTRQAITTHILDLVTGKPAAGVVVQLFESDKRTNTCQRVLLHVYEFFSCHGLHYLQSLRGVQCFCSVSL